MTDPFDMAPGAQAAETIENIDDPSAPRYQEAPYEQPAPHRPGQFRPGKSGNPKGRPKGSKNKTKAPQDVGEAFDRALSKTVSAPIGNGRRRRTTRDLLAYDQIATKFANGDLEAMAYVTRQFEKEAKGTELARDAIATRPKFMSITVHPERNKAGKIIGYDAGKALAKRIAADNAELEQAPTRDRPSQSLIEALMKKVWVKQGKHRLRMTRMAIGCDRLANMVARGDVKAVKLFARLQAQRTRAEALKKERQQIKRAYAILPAPLSEKEWIEEAENYRHHPCPLYGIPGAEALFEQWVKENPTLVAEYDTWVEAQARKRRKMLSE